MKKLILSGLFAFSLFTFPTQAGVKIGLIVGSSSSDIAEGGCNFANEVFTSIANNTPDLPGPVSFACGGDDSDTAFGVNLAYNFTKNFGLEIGYTDHGELSSELNLIGDAVFTLTGTNQLPTIEAELTSYYIAGTASYFFNNKFSATARLGYGRIELDASVLPISAEAPRVDSSDDTEELMAGISLDYHFYRDFSAGIRYDFFDLEEDLDTISLALTYTF